MTTDHDYADIVALHARLGSGPGTAKVARIIVQRAAEERAVEERRSLERWMEMARRLAEVAP